MDERKLSADVMTGYAVPLFTLSVISQQPKPVVNSAAEPRAEVHLGASRTVKSFWQAGFASM